MNRTVVPPKDELREECDTSALQSQQTYLQKESVMYLSTQNDFTTSELVPLPSTQSDSNYVEDKILEVQEEFKSKVIKHNYLRKRKGIFIKSFKLFHVFLLENGLILFYTVTAKSKKYGKESRRHRI